MSSRATAGDLPRQPLARSLSARLSRRVRDEGGQALVEFALLLPIFLILMFGTAEFGLALNTTNDETHLANEVARYVSVNYDPAQGKSLVTWAKEQADSNFLLSNGQICITFPNGNANVGEPVEVIARTKMSWIPLLPKGVQGRTELKGRAVMRIEAPPESSLLEGSKCT
jgi:hypothetical protein